ncbi:3-oxoacyl-[acyl-carrier-protein] synthase-3 [Alkalibacterium putridalgicola]|uniref:Beta-ketoacyl-[acyl-carrier-protein] synthase III n=1 Tax=Alkalibacterium putridalgicola TaxID=426703 RepID=A0A1H7PZU1_9LACT|nr:beta-ketoacyl-ACP synthase III [Alkalibacterium putridalgicola]GEK88105.1 3-oxoacyl-[acyl-carrier-protein] synthase 3 [Alkalibacterium putridalgicola]SEL40765.1 3-oxoacyl-[acyl-carrier-protein] synthase-3 [Alkalibacterium putridalgicola]
MKTFGVTIHSTGRYVPDNEVYNETLTHWMETSDEWIRKRTGIKKRHLSTGEDTSDLCIRASQAALSKQKIDVSQIGLVIVATMTPDSQSPSVASKVQAAIKAENAVAFDLSAACSGFIYGLSAAEKMLRHMSHPYALVIGGEVMSKTLDWSDRKTSVLFGDGAGAVLLKRDGDTEAFIAEDLHTDGGKGSALVSGEQEVTNPVCARDAKNGFLTMDGRAIFNFVTKSIPNSITQVVKKGSIDLEEVDFFLLHQANARIIEIVSKKIDRPLSKFPMNIENYGNTSAASLPILLDESIENGTIRLGSGQTIVLSAFGGGLTWGTLLIKI